MKIAITGHTRGVGKIIHSFLAVQDDHRVDGFSRSNGWPMPDRIDELVEVIKDYDLFINNAYFPGHGDLVWRVASAWKGVEGKYILHMSTTAVHAPRTTFPYYTAYKVAAEKFVHSAQNQWVWPRITNFRFGTVDVESQAHRSEPKLSTLDFRKVFTLWLNLIVNEKDIHLAELTVKNPNLLITMGGV